MVRLSPNYDVHPLEKEYTKRNLKLRDYQEVGVKTMAKWFETGKGGINGDEMGLGKTCQAIVVMTILYNQGAGPFIVSAPLSVLAHWMKEIPLFSCGVLQPIRAHPVTHFGAMHREGIKVERNMVFVTSNKVIVKPSVKTRHHPILEIEKVVGQYFKYVIIDEAQVLKGSSVFRKMLYEEKKDRRFLLLTGTPLQNNVAEAFSLLQFLDDSYDEQDITDTRFLKEYETEKGLQKLKTILSTCMIRRLKSDVLTIPEYSEIVVYHGLSPLQKEMYMTHIGGNMSKIRSLNLFLQLRKIVSHPYLFKGVEPEPFEEGEHIVLQSGKMRMFSDLCRYLKLKKHKVLVFCQYLTTCAIIEDFFEMRGYRYRSMCGTTPWEERVKNLDDFQNDEDIFAFVMTTKTGGFGLTLTAADTVLFYDSDFNPHNDLQAMARAHRIGQEKTVRVIRLIGSGTADDYVYNIAFKKLKLHKGVTGESIEPTSLVDFDEFRRMYNGGAITDAVAMSDEDIEKLLGKTDENTQWGEYVNNEENFVQDSMRPERLKDFMVYEGSSYRKVRDKNILEREEKAWGDYKPVTRKAAGFYTEPDMSEFMN